MDGYFNFKYKKADAIAYVTLELWKEEWTSPIILIVSEGHTDSVELEGYSMILINVETLTERMFSEIEFQFYVSKNRPLSTGGILIICFGSLGVVLIVILVVCLIRRKKRNNRLKNRSRQPLMANQQAYHPQQDHQVTQVTQVQT